MDAMSTQLLKLQNISHQIEGKVLYININADIYSKDKIGLIGSNGAGKTTLIKILTDEIRANTGKVTNSLKSYAIVPQEITIADEFAPRVIEFCISNNMSTSLNQPDQDEYLRLFTTIDNFENGLTTDLEPYLDAIDEFNKIGGYELLNEIKVLLSKAGFSKEQTEMKLNQLSEGQKRLAYLIKIMARNQELLILDEPTNHVDSELKQHYIKLINQYPGAVLTISHDRELLSSATTKIWEIEDKQLFTYNGNWDVYTKEHPKILLARTREYDSNSKEMARLLDLQKRASESQAKQVATWIERAEKDLTVPKPKSSQKQLKTSIEYKGFNSEFIVRLKDFSVSINDKEIISNLSAQIKSGEKVAITGRNGSGKSTLLKMLMSVIVEQTGGNLQTEIDGQFIQKYPSAINYASYTGEVKVSPSTSLGYFDQKLQFGNENISLYEYIRETSKCDRSKIYSLLAKYLFEKSQIDVLLTNLSGGEKNRLQLMNIIEANNNLLLLDEPTNHLDLPNIESLEQMLINYNGTIIFISHDSYFVNKLADRIIEI
jgi:ATP-binding cassette, subfamily F, member 3